MSEASSERDLLIQTANALFGDLCTPELLTESEGSWAPTVWSALEDSGLSTVSVPESVGGSGGTVDDAAVLVGIGGRYAAPVPLAETCLLAGWLLGLARIAVPAGPLTLVEGARFERAGGDTSISVHAKRVPFASVAQHLVVFGHDGDGASRVALVDAGASEVVLERSSNMAAEPRDTVRLDAARVEGASHAAVAVDAVTVRLRGAFARAIQLGGGLERALAFAVQHALEREQFGRPIGKFQVIQAYLAEVAGEVVAARGAIDFAVRLVTAGAPMDAQADAIAVAKIRAGEAAGKVVPIVHQINGAIGFTDEHALHHTTRRLWSWRDEFGSEVDWAGVLGRRAALAGGDGLWPWLSSLDATV